MAKYFLDFEFIEGFKKPLFSKRRHFIDMISVGIVCDDGREFYAISTDFNPKDADEWVKNNVISKLPQRKVDYYDSPRMRQEALLWKSQKQIVRELIEFFKCEFDWDTGKWYAPEGIEVYGYYADYDWVLLCSLFGRMIDLPNGFPMYCRDLKQTLDERAASLTQMELTTELVNMSESGWETTAPLPKNIIDISKWTISQRLQFIKSLTSFPKEVNEHNALADAKWNHELYKFILTI